jgi:hypothetical protein
MLKFFIIIEIDKFLYCFIKISRPLIPIIRVISDQVKFIIYDGLEIKMKRLPQIFLEVSIFFTEMFIPSMFVIIYSM